MSLLLTCLSVFIACFYIVSAVTGDFFEYIKGNILGEKRIFYRIMSYVEAAFIVLMLVVSERGSQSIIFTFILLGWLLVWALFISTYDIILDKRKGYLFLWVSVIIYAIITIINANLTYLWIKTI